ncbi:MAG: PqqD family protein [Polyangiales bacterium]
MSTPAPTPQYRIDPHARFRVMDDEGVFVLQEAGEVLVVNAVGAFIVEQLKTERTLDELVTTITDKYAVDEERARLDATSLLDELLQAGAIIRS